MKDTLINLVQRLLKKNQIPFDKEEVSFQIQSHPSYPSLHAITGVLDHFNIENVAADVPVNTETLLQLPTSFIAQINTEEGNDLVVVEKKGENYILYNTENKKQSLSENDFLKKFTGIIVAVEESEQSTAIKTNSNVIKIIAFSLFIGLAGFILYKNATAWHTIAYLALSIIGIITSIAIIKQELGLKTAIGDAFCTGTDDKKDCDAVLTSKGAEIIKGYKLSDFSILYFTGLTLLTFFQLTDPTISYAISLVAIPITLYSIYYQYAVVKKWCFLCLSIVGLLWLQSLIPAISNTYSVDFTIANLVVFGLVSLATWLFWSYVKPLFTDIHQLKKEKIEHVKFKRNYTLFEILLQKSPQLNTQLVSGKEIIFGNKNSNLEIVIITNPFCGHCKPVHKHIDEILHRYAQNVKISIRFAISSERKEGNLLKITSRLLEIYDKQGQNNCLKAMSEIYEDGNTEAWLKKWGNCTDINYYVSELEKGSNWCKENAINFTPEILINGKYFPKEYNRTDLIFFIEDLEENCQEVAINL
ncbi:vitamin K epoxide reductase family protein [Tenacibaculum finnmarkense]|uniref:vitamin K epoxide reductase family protein n=1 Tax=Tenacibaculum finnmarkense TaxID=2781243 RepID=UPI001E30294D|nr:vitamin K epoxide reductase family protein [Tenacibaculum finnmarkense]MCD8413440.1 thioredoxin domain-containing protein [Tenacibaculum finnmarkense genomovar ulcerans]MCG8207435.1 thioredoxin domain-containing protein [Tenacibaculum finnmarkense genomovar finnmarkense]MCG8723546.1 thioredoxin domain-containing protein [Tenacibaculum finnmarkense]MCG8741769.1 thioredoxin domain-containing protein [Tenacibaculum finnmarkense]MCG8765210.1 thioredoxin domain-containing protein [Tenacibaculum 